MFEISISLKENGIKKSLGHLIREAGEDLKKRYKPFEVALRLVECKRGQEEITLKYDIAGERSLTSKQGEGISSP